jgi:hypothetical protein
LIGQGIHLHPLAVIIAILSGHELAGIAGVFLAIPVVAILTVSYRHWLEHRGSEGLADLLETTPIESVELKETLVVTSAAVIAEERDEVAHSHPNVNTTPDDMASERPDLTTGELKMPVAE